MSRRFTSVAFVASVTSVASVASAQTTWHIGHSYSSLGALRQPATMVGVKSNGGPWLSKVDAGVLVAFPGGRRFSVELGARASTGSARTRAERVYGATVRTGWSFPGPQLGLSLGAEYEADGGFDEKRLAAVAELTPLAIRGVPGLGRFTGPGATGFRWRPWLGAAAVSDENFRGHARLEAELRVPLNAWVVEGDVEATSWYRDGGVNGTSWLEAALSIEFARTGPTLTLSAEEGRRPPRFLKSSRAALGVGFRM